VFKVIFWGVRGSIPTPHPDMLQIGGNTSCVEIRCGKEIIIIDAGTGLRILGTKLLSEMPLRARIFFSHVHWDHIQGFPFFAPAFKKGNYYELYGGKNVTPTLEETLKGQMTYPNFPVSLDQMESEFSFHNIEENEKVYFQNKEIVVSNTRLNHPGGGFSYRIDYASLSVIYASDTEHFIDRIDPNLLSLAKDGDLLIYDAQFTPEEYEGKQGASLIGWGHSTWLEGVKLAKAANVKRLVLFHHDPCRTDEMIREIEKEASLKFPNTIAAYEGLEIDLL
jgi:phosphoribosyl 1,2-cyclic phosphodiesterase